jgi:hypothetical protein
VGDVHGCGDELQELIDPFVDTHHIVLLGDMFDRAFEGMLVWEMIHKYNMRCIMGNHEYKMKSFLMGARSLVPKHYVYFLNEFAKHYDLQILLDFLNSLPTILIIEEVICVHAGIDILTPSKEDFSLNVYGEYKDANKNAENRYWWNFYNGDPVIFYGHYSFNSIKTTRIFCKKTKL